MSYAEELGYRIKHLGIAKRVDDAIELRVHPTLIPEKRLIANVNGVMNAVLVKGDAVGNTLHYGAGAGADPTASAVVADIIDVARMLDAPQSSCVPGLGFNADAITALPVKPVNEFEIAFYLRFEVDDSPGVMSNLSAVFAQQNISIEGITQKEPKKGEDTVSVIFITQKTTEGRMDKALSELQKMDVVREPAVKIRVEHLD